MNLSESEIEALRVVVDTLHDCWYRDVLKALLDRGLDARKIQQ